MNTSTKFTQTKFKDRPPPPVPKPRRHKKRCAPPVPDGETSEARTSAAEYAPPPPPADLKDFLIDAAQEVVTDKPFDIINHLAKYTTNLQARLRQREEEENALRVFMEEEARRLEMEDRASRIIQMAFRAFKMRKAKEKSELLMKHYLAEGVTLEQANRAAICIQRNYRRYTMNERVKLRLQRDAADRDAVSPYLKKKKRSESLIRLLKQIDEPDLGRPVTELYGPKTPFNAEGEKFGVDPACHMAAPLLANQFPTDKMASIDEDINDHVPTDHPTTEIIVEEDAKDISIGSSEKVKAGETGDAVVSGSEDLKGEENADMAAPSSEPNDAETSPPPTSPQRSIGSVTKEPSVDEENKDTSSVPEGAQESTDEQPGGESTMEQPSGEKTTPDAPQEQNPVKEPSDTKAPTVDNGDQ